MYRFLSNWYLQTKQHLFICLFVCFFVYCKVSLNEILIGSNLCKLVKWPICKLCLYHSFQRDLKHLAFSYAVSNTDIVTEQVQIYWSYNLVLTLSVLKNFLQDESVQWSSNMLDTMNTLSSGTKTQWYSYRFSDAESQLEQIFLGNVLQMHLQETNN